MHQPHLLVLDLEDVNGISDDSVNRFLEREKYKPKDLFSVDSIEKFA